MRVGLFLTNQHPPGSDVAAGQDGQLDMFRLARDAGWDSVFAGQHYLSEGMAMPQPVPFLARIAAESDDMAVGHWSGMPAEVTMDSMRLLNDDVIPALRQA